MPSNADLPDKPEHSDNRHPYGWVPLSVNGTASFLLDLAKRQCCPILAYRC